MDRGRRRKTSTVRDAYFIIHYRLLMVGRAYLQHGPAWERVSQVVGRMAVHCRDRHRNHIAEQEIRNTGKLTMFVITVS